MLNNRKIRLMTKLALYEKKEGKEDIKRSVFYKTDYVRYHILKTIVSVSVGYLIILGMIILYKSEYLIAKAVELNYKNIGKTVLGMYLMILTVYGIGIAVGSAIQYTVSRKKLSKYFKMLRRLRMIYREEDGESEIDSSREETK